MQIDFLIKCSSCCLCPPVEFVFGIYFFLKNNNVKRGEWHNSLYEKFLEGDLFKKIRFQKPWVYWYYKPNIIKNEIEAGEETTINI